MNVASYSIAVWRGERSLPQIRPLRLIAVAAVGLLVTLITLPLLAYLFDSPDPAPPPVASVPRSTPYIPNVLLSELASEKVKIESTETYLFNFRANSFNVLSFIASDQHTERLQRSFDVLLLPVIHRQEFINHLTAEAARQNLHPCFVAAVLQAPFVSDDNRPVRVNAFLAAAPAEAFSRAAVVGLPVNSYEELAVPQTAARVAVRYLDLLREIYPGQGNVMVLAYWNDVDDMKGRLSGEKPFEVTDLDLLQSSVAAYERCFASDD